MRGRRPIYTNEVTCDCVYSQRPNSLLIDLPPGEYSVWLLFGRSAGSSMISTGGTITTLRWPWAVVSSQPRRPSRFSDCQVSRPYVFEKRILRAKLSDGQLSIDLLPQTDWMLACVVVFPTAKEKPVRAEFLDSLEKEVYFLPPEEAEKWKETRHQDDRPMPDFDATDRRRGYALFARHWSEVVYPNTVHSTMSLSGGTGPGTGGICLSGRVRTGHF